MIITSLENSKVKNLLKLQQKKYRDETKKYLVEGEHLVEEALKAGVVIEIITTEEQVENNKVPVTYVSYEVMKKISSMDTPPSIAALCQKDDNNTIKGNKIVILDEIQDPGNLGTIIRSALAFNVDTIILSKKCVDLYHPKVLRGTQGMIFHSNIILMDTEEAIKKMKEVEIPVMGTSVEDGIDIHLLQPKDKEKYCLIMGNEGNGLSQNILNQCDKKLYIPMNPKVESLNVGVACSIILYELGK